MTSPAQPAVMAVAAGLVFQNGRVLLSQRLDRDHLGGLWEFPGGKIEPGETPDQCLRRELREELDIEVAVGEPVAVIEHAYPERRVRLHFLRCRLVSGQPRAVGCQAFAWAAAPELAGYDFPAADASLLELLRCSPALWRDARAGEAGGH